MISLNRNSAAALLLIVTSACTPQQSEQTATLVITDARIWTGNVGQPWADAVAADGDKIIAVGELADIQALVGPATRTIAAPGAMLVPGFIDSHVHFISSGSGLASVQLRDAASQTEFAARLESFAATVSPGEWILYGTWDHEMWGGELPRRDWIDAVTPDNPVWVYRLDGHMALANSLALEIAGVDADTPDIAGGTIVRYADDRPTGLLKDNALKLVQSVVPASSNDQLDRDATAAMQYVASHGVTSVHDMPEDDISGWQSLATYRRLLAAETLTTRIYAAVPLRDWERLRDEIAARGTGNEWLRIGSLKGFMDGSLGSHTAAMLEPFTDTPDDKGFLINSLDDMREWITGADNAGLQPLIHAIGDSAIRDLLDIYVDVVAANGDRDRRFRVEHAQHIAPADIERFVIQDVIASMQPYHAIDDGRWAEKVIGAERARTTYAFQSLIDSGARVAFGSDWSVAPAKPIDGIYAAVTRQTLDGVNTHGWIPEEKITVEQALHAYTTVAAYAAFEEDVKGMIKVGMLADFVLLDRDLSKLSPEDIRDTEVLHTIVGGETVYQRN